MNITFENYILEAEDIRFNLFKKGTGKDKSGAVKETKSCMGYGMTFENCLKAIVHDKLKLKEGEVLINK